MDCGAVTSEDTSICPRDQLGKFYCDSLTHDEDAMKLVVKVFGASETTAPLHVPTSQEPFTAVE